MSLAVLPAGKPIAIRPAASDNMAVAHEALAVGADMGEGQHVHAHSFGMLPFRRAFESGARLRSLPPLHGKGMNLKCGDSADGLSTVKRKGNEIFDLLLKTLSGRCSEEFGFGEADFVPWPIGAAF